MIDVQFGQNLLNGSLYTAIYICIDELAFYDHMAVCSDVAVGYLIALR